MHHEYVGGSHEAVEVTHGEWIEYYNNVSMSIDSDEYFELMMNNAWNLKNDKVTTKGWGA